MDRTQLDRLYELLGSNAKNQVPIQTAWGIVKEFDWESKTATVLGLVDNLEYYDVSLGLGNTVRKPKINTKCIIGSIGNQEVDNFLIDCDEVDEVIIKSKDAEIHVTTDGLVLKNETVELKEVLQKLLEELDRSIIKTPSGPGLFSEQNKVVFKQLKNDVLTLFK